MKPWEELDAKGGIITRIADSSYGVRPYEHGFIVGQILYCRKSEKFTLQDRTCKYPSTLESLARVVKGLGHSMYDARSFKDAMNAHVQACAAAMRIPEMLEELAKEQVRLAENHNNKS